MRRFLRSRRSLVPLLALDEGRRQCTRICPPWCTPSSCYTRAQTNRVGAGPCSLRRRGERLNSLGARPATACHPSQRIGQQERQHHPATKASSQKPTIVTLDLYFSDLLHNPLLHRVRAVIPLPDQPPKTSARVAWRCTCPSAPAFRPLPHRVACPSASGAPRRRRSASCSA